MGKFLEFKFTYPKLYERLKERESELMLFTAALMQTNRGMLFNQEGAYNGHTAWKPLVFRNGQILKNRGTLSKSLNPPHQRDKPGRGDGTIVRLTGGVVTIGTDIKYARMMNDGTTKLPGGVLRPVNAMALKIPLPPGFVQQQKARAEQMHEAIFDTTDRKRELSLQRRLDRLNDLIAEAAASGKAKQRKAYVKKLEAELRDIQNGKTRPADMKKAAKKLMKRKERVETDKGKFIFRKSVKIPARPFDEITEQDLEEFAEATATKIWEVLVG